MKRKNSDGNDNYPSLSEKLRISRENEKKTALYKKKKEVLAARKDFILGEVKNKVDANPRLKSEFNLYLARTKSFIRYAGNEYGLSQVAESEEEQKKCNHSRYYLTDEGFFYYNKSIKKCERIAISDENLMELKDWFELRKMPIDNLFGMDLNKIKDLTGHTPSNFDRLDEMNALVSQLDAITIKAIKGEITSAQAKEEMAQLDWKGIGDRTKLQAFFQGLIGIISIIYNMVRIVSNEASNLKNIMTGNNSGESKHKIEKKREEIRESISLFGASMLFGKKSHLKTIVCNLVQENNEEAPLLNDAPNT